MNAHSLEEEELNEIYTWIDTIPLSRPKKNIGRDFADGVLAAEVVSHHFPKLVDTHNYQQANSTQSKLYNWNTLNTKVFKKMGFQLSAKDIDAVINCKEGAIEKVLRQLQLKLRQFVDTDTPENGKSSNQNTSQVLNTNNSMTCEKDQQIIQEQKETIEILDIKINKLEQLIKLKDARIQVLTEKLSQLGYKI